LLLLIEHNFWCWDNKTSCRYIYSASSVEKKKAPAGPVKHLQCSPFWTVYRDMLTKICYAFIGTVGKLKISKPFLVNTLFKISSISCRIFDKRCSEVFFYEVTKQLPNPATASTEDLFHSNL
jgi:hypothetical protein